jgi:stage II sporulation protein AA (anti-sigma F factor antagonist)
MSLTLCVCPEERGTVVRIGGEIDVAVAKVLEQGLLSVMRAHTSRLLLDLSAITFFDCSGIRVLLLTRRQAESRSGSMDLIEASAPVRRIIGLAGLRDAFPVNKEGRKEQWQQSGMTHGPLPSEHSGRSGTTARYSR